MCAPVHLCFFIQVKLAEDTVARGSLTTTLSHLLQNYLNMPHNYMSMDHAVAPIILPGADHNSPYMGVPKSTIGLEVFSDAVVSSGLVASIDPVGHVPETWTWESHVASVSK